MPFNSSDLNKYIDKKAKAIDSTIEEKTTYLKTIQNKLDYYDILLRRQNALSAITKQLGDGDLTDEVKIMIRSIIRSLVFDIDSENVEVKKVFNTKRKTVVENEIEALKRRKQEIIDLKN